MIHHEPLFQECLRRLQSAERKRDADKVGKFGLGTEVWCVRRSEYQIAIT